jgi:hypothetical protein
MNCELRWGSGRGLFKISIRAFTRKKWETTNENGKDNIALSWDSNYGPHESVNYFGLCQQCWLFYVCWYITYRIQQRCSNYRDYMVMVIGCKSELIIRLTELLLQISHRPAGFQTHVPLARGLYTNYKSIPIRKRIYCWSKLILLVLYLNILTSS